MSRLKVNTVFLNGAFVGVSQCACSKINRNKPMLPTVTSFYANPYSRTTYANGVKISKLGAGTTAILNIGYAAPTPARGNFPPEKAKCK